ncbi:hypothetical protein PISMIDRAFT_117909 [Pisolithus microcarpus 441]|uniref:Uncharacterized protein n=1 Tax=Pisolithus microcarpus 441 TaxID=765257 RepID=A0A0C9YJJ0_9AGAM|nr:hypothetical protein BKA83DRAFT_117909 [Pisolithus microcarpus]KIK13954.1 hypothetical protein PISMIDRAFT_117909 [Pisolithus microcarpus 441]
MICKLPFPLPSLPIKFNHKTLVIVLETEIYMYNISNMWLLHIIETAPIPKGEHGTEASSN